MLNMGDAEPRHDMLCKTNAAPNCKRSRVNILNPRRALLCKERELSKHQPSRANAKVPKYAVPEKGKKMLNYAKILDESELFRIAQFETIRTGAMHAMLRIARLLFKWKGSKTSSEGSSLTTICISAADLNDA